MWFFFHLYCYCFYISAIILHVVHFPSACPPLSKPKNGGYTCHPSPCRMFAHGTVIEFFCDDGFVLSGDYNYLTCQDGQWDGPTQISCASQGWSVFKLRSSRRLNMWMVCQKNNDWKKWTLSGRTHHQAVAATTKLNYCNNNKQTLGDSETWLQPHMGSPHLTFWQKKYWLQFWLTTPVLTEQAVQNITTLCTISYFCLQPNEGNENANGYLHQRILLKQENTNKLRSPTASMTASE